MWSRISLARKRQIKIFPCIYASIGIKSSNNSIDFCISRLLRWVENLWALVKRNASCRETIILIDYFLHIYPWGALTIDGEDTEVAEKRVSIVDRRSVFTLFRHENDRSVSVVVTRIVQPIWYAMWNCVCYARYGSINLSTFRRLWQSGDRQNSSEKYLESFSVSRITFLTAWASRPSISSWRLWYMFCTLRERAMSL